MSPYPSEELWFVEGLEKDGWIAVHIPEPQRSAYQRYEVRRTRFPDMRFRIVRETRTYEIVETSGTGDE